MTNQKVESVFNQLCLQKILSSLLLLFISLYHFNILYFSVQDWDIADTKKVCTAFWQGWQYALKLRKCTKGMQFSVVNYKSKVDCLDTILLESPQIIC